MIQKDVKRLIQSLFPSYWALSIFRIVSSHPTIVKVTLLKIFATISSLKVVNKNQISSWNKMSCILEWVCEFQPRFYSKYSSSCYMLSSLHHSVIVSVYTLRRWTNEAIFANASCSRDNPAVIEGNDLT